MLERGTNLSEVPLLWNILMSSGDMTHEPVSVSVSVPVFMTNYREYGDSTMV